MHAPAKKKFGHQAPLWEHPPENNGTSHEVSTVALFGGNSIVGRALELLLKGAGYDVRLLGEPGDEDRGVLLEGANLLLIAPMLDAATTRKITDQLGATAALAALPVLALVTTPAEHPLEGGRARHVSWPCRTKELTRQIGAALSRPRTANTA